MRRTWKYFTEFHSCSIVTVEIELRGQDKIRPDTSLDLDGIMFLYNLLPTKGISGRNKLLEGKIVLH